MSKACVIKGDKECEAHLIKEVATKNDIKEVAMDNMAKVIDQRRMESSTLVLETWAIPSENQRETQETEGGGEEAKVRVDANNGNITTDNDKGPKMARTSKDHGEDSSKLVLKTSVETVVSESQHEAEEMEGGCEEAKDEASVCKEDTKQSATMKADVHNIEVKESGTMDNDVQASQEDLKGVPGKVIMSSNMKEDTSMKIKGMMVNSNARVYHNEWMKERHAIWSLRDPEMSMRLKELRRVVNINIRMRSCEGKQGTRKNEGSKFLDQGDRRDEGGTYTL